MEDTSRSQVDLRQSAAYTRYIQSIGWRVERVGEVNIFIRPLGIFGAITKIQRVELPIPWPKIRSVLKRHRVWMTKVEPLAPSSQFSVLSSQLKKFGFRQDGWPLLATKTLRLDLTKPFLFKKDTRYSIRKSQVAKPKSQLNNFDNFYDLWRKANKIKRLWTPPKKHFDSLIRAFGDNCFCITIDNLAGALVLIHDKTAYYYYAAALPEGKKRLLPYSGVWESMQEAKRRGCKIWDWEGIFDPRWPNKSTLGYSRFKKSFGGYELSFPGSFTKWF